MELYRPKQLNAFSKSLFNQIGECINKAAVDPDVRVVIISGQGKHFTAGLDLKEATSDTGMASPLSQEKAKDPGRKMIISRPGVLNMQEQITALDKCNKPIICVLHGHSIGAGIDLTSAGDIRICSADAKFTIKEVDVGLAPDVGTLQRFPKVVGNQSWAKQMIYTAKVFSAEEAFQNGFVSEVLPTKEEAFNKAVALGKEIASKSPIAVQGSKHLLDYSRDHSIQDGKFIVYIENNGIHTNFSRSKLYCHMGGSSTTVSRSKRCHESILYKESTSFFKTLSSFQINKKI